MCLSSKAKATVAKMSPAPNKAEIVYVVMLQFKRLDNVVDGKFTGGRSESYVRFQGDFLSLKMTENEIIP